MIKFELLTANDIPEIVNHMVAFYAIDGYPIHVEKTTQLFHEFITKPELGSCFMIKYNNEICGYTILIQFFSFEMSGYVLLLDELYVSDTYQGKGIGKEAMTFIKEFAVNNHYKKLVLEVEPHNERAIHLYEKENFRKHKRDLMLFP
ncbi:MULTISPECIES: GNAT family N-acetyltransferase [unclassified Flavobacterium]|uniref:GNAT family N-acetyltransferase n=1 Tax=unclassified Flavobacterium TaxID=196869 RepID=UPI0013D6A938|nr:MULTISPECIES: GNAT family N-acetyltransferase [unclassified Flavobacterium]MBA5792440.1 GNAT family N-acetyltransferase [Flavobacterium sp. xlx-221]